MSSYYNRKPLSRVSVSHKREYKRYVNPKDTTLPILENRAKLKDTTSLSLRKKTIPNIKEPVLPDEGIVSEDEEELSLISYIVYMVLNMWKLFKDTPLAVRSMCIVLIILASLMLSFIVNILIQLAFLLLSPLYTILGIIASGIVIYEFLKQRKGSKGTGKKT